MADVHFLPPSSSVLLALSESLEPPSPTLSSFCVSCSDDVDLSDIPILFDFALCELEEPDCAETAPLCLTGRASVGTFGPLLRQSPSALRSPVLSIHSNPSADSSLNVPTSPPLSRGSSAGSLGAQDTSVEVLRIMGPSHSASTISSSAPLSPSPSANSCRSLRRKFKFPVDCNNDAVLPASKSGATQASESREDLSAGNLLVVLGARNPPVQETQPSRVLQPCTSPRCAPSDHSTDILVPENLAWLRNTVVELMIDQEGFRAVNPTLKIAGFRKQVRGWHPSDSDDGWVVFRPVRRETFRFHYAPLDGLPILRRLTVNADESRDYISRQATLHLKANGVYTVQGSESSHLPPTHFSASPKASPHSTHAKLKWKFEYLVDDQLERSGRIVDGEKTFTPLTFMCSPWLLHPNQGQKMKLMRFVKKSVAAKLVAEKLEPPSLASPSPPPKPLSNHNLWVFHRRVQSHVEEPKLKSKSGSMRRTGKHFEAKTQPDSVGTGRCRRASSAGENKPPISMERHIVPPAQLAELLDAEHADSLSPAPRLRR